MNMDYNYIYMQIALIIIIAIIGVMLMFGLSKALSKNQTPIRGLILAVMMIFVCVPMFNIINHVNDAKHSEKVTGHVSELKYYSDYEGNQVIGIKIDNNKDHMFIGDASKYYPYVKKGDKVEMIVVKENIRSVVIEK